MSDSKFKRTEENFKCERCGTQVTGNGYTNHCPNCLWSKHVDNNPGDRESECHGLMEPVQVRKKDGTMDVLHHCVECGYEKWNHVTEGDNSDILVKISAEQQ